MNSYKVGLKFTVGVGEYSSEFGNEFCGPVLKGPQEQPLGVIVICMDVVPNHWWPSKNTGHFINRLHRNVLGHHFWP